MINNAYQDRRNLSASFYYCTLIIEMMLPSKQSPGMAASLSIKIQKSFASFSLKIGVIEIGQLLIDSVVI